VALEMKKYKHLCELLNTFKGLFFQLETFFYFITDFKTQMDVVEAGVLMMCR
jgi:hypothetical protein